MTTLLYILVGGVVGYFTRIFQMKMSLRDQRIQDKTRVYRELVGYWAYTRNFIIRNWDNRNNDDIAYEFDSIYGESQKIIAEIYLFSKNLKHAEHVNDVNEGFFREKWSKLNRDEMNNRLDRFKEEVLPLLEEMRKDIEAETDFDARELINLFKQNKNPA